METWGWLLAYVVGFGLLQLYLFRYIRRDDPSPEATPGRIEGTGQASIEASTHGDEPDGVHCRHCGTYNEHQPTFAYCKRCVKPLG